MRTSKELLIASKEFAHEWRWQSYWHLLSTLTLLVGLILLAVSQVQVIVSWCAGLLAGFVCVRMFIIFHDYQHKAILRKSKLAGCVLWIYGMWTLNPPTVWNRSHSHHHQHNSRACGVNIGSFPVMTTEGYQQATTAERWFYVVARHPVTVLCGYLTIFAWGMALRPFLRNPARHFDAGLALLLHVTLLWTLCFWGGTSTMWFGMLLPLCVASACGGYLFYAQHNYPTVKLKTASEWSYVQAALESSSYCRMGPILHWLTGNIGFHHVHHLNAAIPFYRLPEAMDALEELQTPGVTSLSIRDIRACFRLKLWDPEGDKFVGFQAARRTDSSFSQRLQSAVQLDCCRADSETEPQ